jgi:hypothetical protein
MFRSPVPACDSQIAFRLSNQLTGLRSAPCREAGNTNSWFAPSGPSRAAGRMRHRTPASSQLQCHEDCLSAMRVSLLASGSFQIRHNLDHRYLVVIRNTLTSWGLFSPWLLTLWFSTGKSGLRWDTRPSNCCIFAIVLPNSGSLLSAGDLASGRIGIVAPHVIWFRLRRTIETPGAFV